MNRIVFDSDIGRTECPKCRRVVSRCKCTETESQPSGDGIVRVRREVRRGKPMTVIIGVPAAEAELKKLAKALKQKCSTGGSCKNAQIEVQGDHRDVVVRELQARGYTVKLAGG